LLQQHGSFLRQAQCARLAKQLVEIALACGAGQQARGMQIGQGRLQALAIMADDGLTMLPGPVAQLPGARSPLLP
jgi:hypothetical protein